MGDLRDEKFINKIENDLNYINENKCFLVLVGTSLVYTQDRKSIKRRKVVIKGMEEIQKQNRIRNMSVKQRADNFVLKDFSSLTSKESIDKEEFIKKTKDFYEKKKSEILRGFRERDSLPVKAVDIGAVDSNLMARIKRKQENGSEGIFKKKKRQTGVPSTVMRRRNSRSIRRSSVISNKSSMSFKETPRSPIFFKKQPEARNSKQRKSKSKKRRKKKSKTDKPKEKSLTNLPSERALMINRVEFEEEDDDCSSSKVPMPEFGLENLNRKEYLESLMDNFVKNVAQDVEEFNEERQEEQNDPVLGDSIIARICKKREEDEKRRLEQERIQLEEIKLKKFKEEKTKLLKKRERLKMVKVKASIKFSMNFKPEQEANEPKVFRDRRYNPIFKSMNTNEFYMRARKRNNSNGMILKKRSKKNLNSLRSFVNVIKTEEKDQGNLEEIKKKKVKSSKKRGRSASLHKKKPKKKKKAQGNLEKKSRRRQEKPTVDEIKVPDENLLEEYNSWDEL